MTLRLLKFISIYPLHNYYTLGPWDMGWMNHHKINIDNNYYVLSVHNRGIKSKITTNE